MFAFRLTPEITLELVEPRHADELFRATDANRDHLRRRLPWVDATRTVEDTKGFIQTTRQQLYENKGFQTAIRFRSDLVGMIGHLAIDWSNRATALGYWLAHDAQGHGIMTMSCRAYVDHAFTQLGLHRVEIRCAPDNRRSRAIPERLGFRAEGTIRSAEWLYDHFVDHVVYGILVDEWEAS